MCKTLYIDLPGNSRDMYKGVIFGLVRYGFNILQPRVAQTATGMQVAVWVDHCCGDVTEAANEFVRALPQGSSIEVDHANPFH